MIRKIHIENFKSIKNQTIELKPINILVGQNGAGKSNFLSLFEFLKKLFKKELQSIGEIDGYFFINDGIDRILYKGTSDYFKINIESNFDNYYKIEIKRNKDNSYRIANESIGALHSEGDTINTPEQKESNLPDYFTILDILDKNKSAKLLRKEDFYSILNNYKFFHFDSSTNSKNRKEIDSRVHVSLDSDGGNVWNYLFFLKQNFLKHYSNVLDAIRFVYPNFIDLDFVPSNKGKELIEVVWNEKGSERGYITRQLSDGTIRFVCLATALVMPIRKDYSDDGYGHIVNSNCIIIDEPEIGLHPHAIHILAELIHKASNHKQIIIATQSVELINKFKPEDLIIVDKINKKMPYGENDRDYEIGETIFSRLTDDELKLTKAKIDFNTWLEDYKLGQLWQSNMFGGNP